MWKEVIPEDKDAHLEDVLPVNHDKLVIVYKRNVSITFMDPNYSPHAEFCPPGERRDLYILD